MNRPSALVSVVAFALLAACGGGDDDTATTVDTTVVASTTPSTEEVFVPVDSGPVDTDADDASEEPVASDEVPDSEPDDDAGVATTDGETNAGDDPATTEVVAGDPPGTTPSSGSTGTGDEPAPTTPSTGSDPAPDPNFTLAVDGIGATSFGADPEGTISFVSSFYGAPDRDTGWVDPFEIGPCGGMELRQVSWGALQLEFGDVSNVTEGRRHFYAYTYGIEGSLGNIEPSGLATPLGITVGSTVLDLIGAYPTAELRSADEFIAANFFVNQNLSGRMSGLADNDVVEVIIGGIPCTG